MSDSSSSAELSTDDEIHPSGSNEEILNVEMLIILRK